MHRDRRLIETVIDDGPFAPDEPPESSPEELPRVDDRPVEVPEDWEMRPPRPDWVPDLDEYPASLDAVRIWPDDNIDIDALAESDAVPSAGTPAYPPNGIDAWAYYKPFHFYRHRDWGIFLLESGIAELSRRILQGAQPVGADRFLIPTLAKNALYLHEFFHHITEVACSRLQHVGKLAGAQPAYPSYFGDRYGSFFEEILANAHAIRELKRTRTLSFAAHQNYTNAVDNLVDEFRKHAPPYSLFPPFVTDYRMSKTKSNEKRQ